MKKHTTVLLLCISLIAGGILTAQEKAGSSFYENGVVKESDSGRPGADVQKSGDKKDYIKWVEFHATCEAQMPKRGFNEILYHKEFSIFSSFLLCF